MGVVVSSSHSLCRSFFLRGGLLTLCPCSSVGSHPLETVPHELPQRGSLPCGAVLQEQAAPVCIPHGVTGPVSKPAPPWAPLSMGSHTLPRACSSVGSPRGHSFLQASTCSGVGSSLGYRWNLLLCGPPWAAETACLTMVCSTGCR